MLGDELVNFLYFQLSEREQPSGEGARCSREEFDSVVPDRMGRKSLGLLFAKDLFVALVAPWYFRVVVVFFGV